MQKRSPINTIIQQIHNNRQTVRKSTIKHHQERPKRHQTIPQSERPKIIHLHQRRKIPRKIPY